MSVSEKRGRIDAALVGLEQLDCTQGNRYYKKGALYKHLLWCFSTHNETSGIYYKFG